MKKIVKIMFIAGCLICSVAFAEDRDQVGCPKSLQPSVEARLLPVLEALDAAARKSDWFDKHYEEEFEKLLNARDKDSRAARIALMDYYIGEHMGEELVCAVAIEGKDVIELIKLHVKCDMLPSRTVVPRNRALPLRKYALEMIERGHATEECTYE